MAALAASPASAASTTAPTFAAAFGSSGSSPGQFASPTGVDVDADGNVYVTDTDNDRFQKFAPDGKLIGSYTSSMTGTLADPYDVAVNRGTGDVYVTDTNNRRVVRYNASGTPVAILGGATFGTPWGLDVGSDGTVWVADGSARTIRSFDRAGVALTTFSVPYEPKDVVQSGGYVYVLDFIWDKINKYSRTGTLVSSFGTNGTNPGQLDQTTGAATDPNGDLYVSEYFGARVQALTPSGSPLTSFANGPAAANVAVSDSANIYVTAYDDTVRRYVGADRQPHVAYGLPGTLGVGTSFPTTAGSGNGQFDTPNGVDIDAVGNVWVADTNNNRVQRLASDGFTFVAAYGTPGQFTAPRDVAINKGTGDVYVADYGSNRVVRLNSSGTLVGTFGTSGNGNGQFSGPKGLGLDAAGNVWVADTGNNRIQKFSASGTFISAQSVSFAPNDVAFSGGNTYVVDYAGNKVYEYTAGGSLVRSFGGTGTALGQLSSPTRIVADAAGDLYVSEFGGGRVQSFTPDGTPINVFGETGLQPRGLAFAKNGTLYVADGLTDGIKRFAPGQLSRGFAGAVGSVGSGSGQFSTPTSVDLTASGNLWVVDRGNDRIQLLSPSGSPLGSFGSAGSGGNQFQSPYDIAVNRTNGDTYVTDNGNNRIVQRDASGTLIRVWGTSGSGPGQFSGPKGIALDATGNLWVADTGNSRLQQFSASGTFLQQRSSTSETAYQPGDIAISGDSIYATDYSGHRIWMYDRSSLTLRGAFATTTSSGSGLLSPTGLDVDAAGNVYVSDYTYSRIQAYTPRGNLLSIFRSSSLSNPRGIAVDPNGSVVVADSANNRVVRLGN